MNADELHHYSRALDEIYRLRGLLAYEAGVIQSHLTLATFPRSRRRFAEEQVTRMAAAAAGWSKDAYDKIDQKSMDSLRRAVGIATLTRNEFEAEDPS